MGPPLPGGGAPPAWKGAIVGAWGDGDPGQLLSFMQQARQIQPGPRPATAPARSVQAAWTGGMPAVFLDNNAAA